MLNMQSSKILPLTTSYDHAFAEVCKKVLHQAAALLLTDTIYCFYLMIKCRQPLHVYSDNHTLHIVLATAKRAREIIAGQEPLVNTASNKPLSIAVDELYSGKVKIVGDDEEEN